MVWGPVDPASGHSADVPPPERKPSPGTDVTAHLQTQRAAQRLAAGEVRRRDDETAEDRRRGLLKAFRQR
jgi:hypothetical protein